MPWTPPILPPERWQQVQALFRQALELDASLREDFLTQQCAQDEELAHRLRRLLQAHEAGSEQLSNLAAHSVGEVLTADDYPRVSTTIGAYRLIRELGSGGMGTVYPGRAIRPGLSTAGGHQADQTGRRPPGTGSTL